MTLLSFIVAVIVTLNIITASTCSWLYAQQNLRWAYIIQIVNSGLLIALNPLLIVQSPKDNWGLGMYVMLALWGIGMSFIGLRNLRKKQIKV